MIVEATEHLASLLVACQKPCFMTFEMCGDNGLLADTNHFLDKTKHFATKSERSELVR